MIEPAASGSEPPPVLGTWRNLYLLVLGMLALCIWLFRVFGQVFS